MWKATSNDYPDDLNSFVIHNLRPDGRDCKPRHISDKEMKFSLRLLWWILVLLWLWFARHQVMYASLVSTLLLSDVCFTRMCRSSKIYLVCNLVGLCKRYGLQFPSFIFPENKAVSLLHFSKVSSFMYVRVWFSSSRMRIVTSYAVMFSMHRSIGFLIQCIVTSLTLLILGWQSFPTLEKKMRIFRKFHFFMYVLIFVRNFSSFNLSRFDQNQQNIYY